MAKKGFWGEFRDFIARGNVMDMAVGVIIGGAFTSIVTSLNEDIISPILGLFGGKNFDKLSLNILGEVTLNYGKFLTAVFNFLIMALVVFCMMKAVNKATEKAKRLAGVKEEEAPPPTTKKCPYCLSEIPIEATKCAHCTSDLSKEA